MRLGSLFAGIGGLELGLEWSLGCETVWQVEREEWPRSVLARHWPDADRSVTDVCEAGAHNLAPVDVICGGFPCQDISPAGKGVGITGEKSGLWSEYARLVRELRPGLVIVENSHLLPVRGLGVVLGDLSAVGYDAEWARIGVSDVGGPHRRWRCFIVAWRANASLPRRGARAGPEEGSECAGRRGPGGVGELAHSDRLGLYKPATDTLRAGRDVVVGGTQWRHHTLSAAVLAADRPGHPGAGWANGGPVGVGSEPARRHQSDGCSAPMANAHGDRLQGQHRQRVATRNNCGGGPPVDGREPLWRHPLPASSLRGVANGVPDWVGDGPAKRAIEGPNLGPDGLRALRALGNAVSPPVAYQVGLWARSILIRERLWPEGGAHD